MPSNLTDTQWLQTVRRAGQIKRCHTYPIHGNHNVAEHSWGVAMLLIRFHPDPSANLLKAALCHDVTEIFTGDVPAPVKWDNPDLSNLLKHIEKKHEKELGIDYELTMEEKQFLKACDLLELALFSLEQMAMGNSLAAEIYVNCHKYFEDNPPPPVIRAFLDKIEIEGRQNA